MIVITSGNRYIDIDAYASMIVYREYLRTKKINCVAISNSTLSDSITPSILNMNYKLDNYNPSHKDQFIILDVSDATMLDKCVDNEKKVIEIIDHHFGYEEYWKNLLGKEAQLENIGSVATLIYEKIVKDHMERIITVDLAKMLISAILDNTLNLQAKMTTSRDINVFNKLMSLIDDEKYPMNYYKELEDQIKTNIIVAIKNETYIYNMPEVIPTYFSQLVVFDKNIVLNNLEEICLNLNNIYGDYAMNLVCLSEGKSYIIATNNTVKRKISFLLNGSFKGNIMEMEDIWLRKEIIKRAQELIDKN